RRDTRVTVRLTDATCHRVGQCIRDRQQRRDKRKRHKEAQQAQRGPRELFVVDELLRGHCYIPTGSPLEAKISVGVSLRPVEMISSCSRTHLTRAGRVLVPCHW